MYWRETENKFGKKAGYIFEITVIFYHLFKKIWLPFEEIHIYSTNGDI